MTEDYVRQLIDYAKAHNIVFHLQPAPVPHTTVFLLSCKVPGDDIDCGYLFPTYSAPDFNAACGLVLALLAENEEGNSHP